MTQHVTHDTVLGPPRNGSLWPYIALPLVGASVMVYLTFDLYSLLSRSGSIDPRDWPILLGMVGITGGFGLLAVAFWYAPWSWATLRFRPDGFTLSVTGLSARKPTDVVWADLASVRLTTRPRGGSFYRFYFHNRRPILVRALAFAADPQDFLPAFEAEARSAGFTLSGKDLKEPIFGTRIWQVAPLDAPRFD